MEQGMRFDEGQDVGRIFLPFSGAGLFPWSSAGRGAGLVQQKGPIAATKSFTGGMGNF
jgi:hypothetical protein